jgi:uncharacterized membrane protein YdcZ (DUF606 family)
VIGALLRFYSYLYHFLLTLFLLGLSLVAVVSNSHTLNLGMLPWKGSALTWWLFGTGLLGALSILLALAGKLRFLFLLYALAVFGMMLRGYFAGAYSFSGKDEFRLAVWLTAGALVAIFGAWSQLRKKRRRAG